MAAANGKYRLQTLGEARLTRDGEILDLSPYGLVILTYLLLSRRSPTRAEICELMWSRDGAEERHRLRQLVYTIKRRAPGTLLDGALAADKTALRVDLTDCMNSARRGDVHAALDLFAGPFLVNIPSFTRAFAEWRDGWAAKVLEVLRVAVHSRLNVSDLAHPEVRRLCDWAEEYDELSPHEIIQRAKVLAAAGAATEAAIGLRRLDEIALPPELQRELAHLRDQVGLSTDIGAYQSPLVLPDSVRNAVAARISSKSRQAILLLTGDSGVGKSRLLDWAARLAAIRGARVFTHAMPHTCRGKTDEGLNRFLDSLGMPRAPSRRKVPAHADTVTLAGAVADKIGGSWTAIAVDNINRGDASTRELLTLLPAMSKTNSIMVLAAMSGNPTLADAHWIDSLLPNIEVLKIDPLPPHLAATLIDKAAAQVGLHLPDTQRQMIVDTGQGIPGRLLQLVSALAGQHSRSAFGPRADLVSSTIANNVRKLSHAERWVLGVIALSAETWVERELAVASATDQSPLRSVLERLRKLSLLATFDAAIGAGALVRETLLAIEEPRTLRQIRIALAAYYSVTGSHARAALYFEEVGDRSKAGEQYQLAGVSSMERGSFDEAERQLKLGWARATTPAQFQERSRLLALYYCRMGRWDDAHPHLLALSHRTPEEELGLLVAGLSTISGHDPDAWQAFVRSLDRLLTGNLDRVVVARVYLKVFDAAYQWGMEPFVLSSFKEYLNRRPTLKPRELAELLTKSARINKLFGDASRALEEAEEAVANAHLCRDPVVLAHAYDTRALVNSLNGDVKAALDDFEASERIASSASLYFLRERYLNNLAVLYYEIGDHDRARQLLHSAMLLSRDNHPYALANLAVLELAGHRYDDARSYAARLRATSSSTGRIIGTTVLGLLSVAENCTADVREMYGQLHSLTHGFRLQLTDPSYTLAFLASCGPIVQFDARPLLEATCFKLEERNVYSYLRSRLALVRLLWLTGANEALPMVRETLRRAREVQAVSIQSQAEALLSSF